MYRGRLRSRRGAATAEASISDILHLPECMGPILGALPVRDLLNLASSSRACRAATSPSCIQLDINSAAGLRALTGLHRLGCLHHLRQAKLTAAVSNSIAGGHLSLLAVCPQLQDLVLIYGFRPFELWWWHQHIEGVTQRGSVLYAAEGAHDQADSEFLKALAMAMPVNTHRRLEKLDTSDDGDHYYCIDAHCSRWERDCHCAFSDLDPLERDRYFESLRYPQKYHDQKTFRCTCHDKVWSWQPGQQAHIHDTLLV